MTFIAAYTLFGLLFSSFTALYLKYTNEMRLYKKFELRLILAATAIAWPYVIFLFLKTLIILLRK